MKMGGQGPPKLLPCVARWFEFVRGWDVVSITKATAKIQDFILCQFCKVGRRCQTS